MTDDTKKCGSQSLWLPAIIVAIGIAVLGLFVKSGISSISDNQRVVTVRGLAEKEVEANKVTWPIVSKELGNDLTQIYNRIQSTNAAIVKFLKDNGITDDEISVSAPQVYDLSADRYSSNNNPYRYTVTTVVVVP